MKHHKSKIIVLFSLIFLLTPLFINVTFAADSVVFANTGHDAWQTVAPGVIWAWGAAFAGNGEYLSKASFRVQNTSAYATGTLQAFLYASTNLTAAVTNASTLENSSTVDMTTIITDQWITFEFNDTYELATGSFYSVVFWCTAGAQTFQGGYDALAGNLGRYRNDAKTAEYNCTLVPTNNVAECYIYSTVDEQGDLPDYDGYDLSDSDAVIGAFTDFMVPLLILVLPALLLFFFLGKSKWLFLIGIAIGAGLGYIYGFVPIWLIFLITIGIVGMAYQDVRADRG